MDGAASSSAQPPTLVHTTHRPHSAASRMLMGSPSLMELCSAAEQPARQTGKALLTAPLPQGRPPGALLLAGFAFLRSLTNILVCGAGGREKKEGGGGKGSERGREGLT